MAARNDGHSRIVIMWDDRRKLYRIIVTRNGLVVIKDADSRCQMDEPALWQLAEAVVKFLEDRLI